MQEIRRRIELAFGIPDLIPIGKRSRSVSRRGFSVCTRTRSNRRSFGLICGEYRAYFAYFDSSPRINAFLPHIYVLLHLNIDERFKTNSNHNIIHAIS